MNAFSHKNGVDAWQWIAFAVIAFCVCVVYSSSLMHVARADQIMYLAEVGHKTSLWDLTVGSLDLNRHRLFAPGDEILFRPVDYLFLGLEKYFFGNNFMCWQAVGIALHLLVVWFLLKLLLALHRGMPAVMGTAFFALLFVNLEMVTWQHINSYMIFVAAALWTLHKFLKIMSGTSPSTKDCCVIFLVILLAAFTHEMGNVLAGLLGVMVFIYKREHVFLYRSLCVIPVIYVLASLLNAWAHPFNTTIYQHHVPQVISNAWYSLTSWLYVGIFPFEFDWLFAARNMIAPEEKIFLKWPNVTHQAALLGVVFVIFITSFLLRKRKSPRLFSSWLVAVLSISLVVTFACVIAFGRGGQWMIWEVIRINTYYMYIFWVFMVVGIYAMVPWKDISRLSRFLFYAVLAGLIFLNAQGLYAVNEKQVKDNNEIIVLINMLELLIKEHKTQPDFTFYVDPMYPGNYIYTDLRSIHDPKSRQYSLAEVLYPKYYKAHNAKYKFLVR